MNYQEDEFLQLSGIQHFRFCRRQWALIHIENQWASNYLTVDGDIMHERAHDNELRESRKEIIITRGVSVFSHTLGVSGKCDILEYRLSNEGIPIKGKDGLWQPYPIEYKRGKPRSDNADELQLCGQAMCLEEMLCCDIPEGALFYGSIHRRIPVIFTDELRSEVQSTLLEMHELYVRGHTPMVKPKKFCFSCSLNELCLPKLSKKKLVSDYLHDAMR